MAAPGTIRTPAAGLSAAAGVLLVAVLLSLPFTATQALAGGDLGFLVVDLVQGLCYAGVGALLLRRSVAGPVPGLLLAIGTCSAVSAAVNQYALLWLAGTALPGGIWALWAQSWLYLPGLGLAAVVLPALLPDGRVAGRRVWLGVAATVLTLHTVVQAVQPGPLLRSGALPSPAGLAGADRLLPWVVLAGSLCLLAGPVLLFRRRRRATGPERTSLSWYLTGDLLLVTALLVDAAGATVLAPYATAFGWSLHLATLPLLPGAILATALRRHAWRLRMPVGHALMWSLLSLGVAWSYVLTVGWLAAVLRTRAGLGVGIAAAALVAVAFEPARARLHRATHRLMYGDRHDPLAVLSRITGHLGEPGEPADTLARVAADVVARIRLAGFAVELARAGGWEGTVLAGAAAGTPVEVPLVDQHEVVGRALAYPRAGERLTPADVELLEQIGGRLAAAVVARGYELDLRRSRVELVTAREEERRRLSHDLHDELGPSLAGIALGLRAAVNQLAAGTPAGVPALLEALSRQAGAAAGEVRRIAHDLEPPWLAGGGFVAALRERVDTTAAAGGPLIVLTAPDRLPDLPIAVEVAAFRVSVEALSNVLRHARATRCDVRITWQDALCVEIADDGIGLPERRVPGIGLTAMRRRAAELDGTLEIGPGASRGTVVRLTLGVPAPAGGSR